MWLWQINHEYGKGVSHNGLFTHLPVNDLVVKLQTTFSSAFSSTKIGLDNGLAPNMRQANMWTNAHPIHWCISAALELGGGGGGGGC